MRISKHARKRAKSRLKWKLSTLERELEKASQDGLTISEVTGELRTYLRSLQQVNRLQKTYCDVILHNEVVFLMDRDILVTIYQMPSSYRKSYNTQK